MAGPRNGMQLSKGMRTFLAVDAVLVTVFLVALALALTGSLSGRRAPGSAAALSSTPGASTAGARPTGSPSSSSTTISMTSFALPSGNISCTMSDTGVRCTIASITFAPPADAACTGTIGHVFEVRADGVHIPCTDGPAPGPAPAGTANLEYGKASTVGGYTCASSTNGVRCVADATGRGFELARASYTQLP